MCAQADEGLEAKSEVCVTIDRSFEFELFVNTSGGVMWSGLVHLVQKIRKKNVQIVLGMY